MKRCLGLLVLVALVSGCSVRQQTVRPTMAADLGNLQEEIDVLPPLPLPASASGSLWTDAGPGAALVRDTRAFRLHDLVTIQLEERSQGVNEGDTELNRSSDNDFGAGVAFGLEKANPEAGKFNLNQVLETSLSSAFQGDGTTSRSNQLTATLTARVMRVLPNGDLMVAGQKNVTINREQQILTLVGTIRPVDIRSDNRITSSSVGNLTVRLWGQGEVDSTIRQGWFMKIMNRIWPF